MNYPIENLLRRPVEFIPAAVSFTAAFGLSLTPETFLLTPALAYLFSFGLVLHAGWRFQQGIRLLRYRANLKRLPRYVLAAGDIPWSERYLFLGLGFRWDRRHSQRLHDTRRPEYRQMLEPGALYRAARRLERKVEGTPFDWLGWITRQEAWWNPVTPLPPVGGDPAIHGVEPEEEEVWMDLAERVGHMLVLGTTRVGKTRLAEILITQDIRRGDVVIVFDPKGDADLLKRMYAEAKRADREDEFYFFHLGYPELSARYNPVGSFSRVTEVATRITNQLPKEGEGANFAQFVWGFVNAMSKAMTALGRTPSYQDIYRYANDIEPLVLDYCQFWLDREPRAAGWREEIETMEVDPKSLDKAMKNRAMEVVKLLAYIREKDLYDDTAGSLMKVISYEQSYYNKLIASLIPLLEKLTTGKVAELVSPDMSRLDDRRPVFDWMGVINRGGIVYVGLDALTDYEVAGAVGNSMFSDLTSTAGRIYKHGETYGQSGQAAKRRISIHADEFNELIGDEFIPLLNKAGGAGYQVAVYTQTWSDVEARIGSRAKAMQIGGNLNTLIMLRVKNTDTAKILTDQLDEVELVTTMSASQASDSNNPLDFSDFTSRNEDRISTRLSPMIGPADLVRLPKGQAFALIEGGKLYKLRMPLPDASHDPLMPEDLAAVADDMQSRYARVSPGEFEPGTGWRGEDVVTENDYTEAPDWLKSVIVEGRGGGG
jgi:conjugal transfer pilus assembly protein TraD